MVEKLKYLNFRAWINQKYFYVIVQNPIFWGQILDFWHEISNIWFIFGSIIFEFLSKKVNFEAEFLWKKLVF